MNEPTRNYVRHVDGTVLVFRWAFPGSWELEQIQARRSGDE